MNENNELEISAGDSWNSSKLVAVAIAALAIAILAFGIILLVLFARATNWSHSRITDAFETEGVLTNAGVSQGITLTRNRFGESHSNSAVMKERRVRARLLFGTAGQLLAAYQTAVRQEIERCGGTIHESGQSGAKNVEDFSYNYSCDGSDGMVMVWSFDHADGEVDIVTLYYEHRK